MSKRQQRKTHDDIMEFLCHHQPMPPDRDWDDEMLRDYSDAIDFLFNNKANDIIPLYLGSFGDGAGWGHYERLVDALLVQDHDVLVSCLKNTIGHHVDSIRYWSIQIAGDTADTALASPIEERLSDENPDIRIAAATALVQIGCVDSVSKLRERLKDERVSEVVEALIESIEILDNPDGSQVGRQALQRAYRYLDMGQSSVAQAQLEIAISSSKKSSDSVTFAQASGAMGQLLIDLGKWREASKYLENVLQLRDYKGAHKRLVDMEIEIAEDNLKDAK